MDEVIKLEDEVKKAAAIETTKKSIQILEGFFHGLDNSAVPLKYHEAVMEGFKFCIEVHKVLVSQLPPEEIEKIKAEQAAKEKK